MSPMVPVVVCLLFGTKPLLSKWWHSVKCTIHLGIIFSEVAINIDKCSSANINLKMSSAKCLPFGSGLNVLNSRALIPDRQDYQAFHFAQIKVARQGVEVWNSYCLTWKSLSHGNSFCMVGTLRRETTCPLVNSPHKGPVGSICLFC